MTSACIASKIQWIQTKLRLYELERCVECGVCFQLATKQMRETFVGAVGMMKIARFEMDSRDARTAEDFYHVNW